MPKRIENPVKVKHILPSEQRKLLWNLKERLEKEERKTVPNKK